MFSSSKDPNLSQNKVPKVYRGHLYINEWEILWVGRFVDGSDSENVALKYEGSYF